MRIFLVGILCLFFLNANSQQRSLVSNYLQNGIVISPAFTGSAGALSLSLSSRLQTFGDNPPVTNILAAHTPLPFRFISTGIVISYDKFDPLSTTDVSNSYALRFKVKNYKVSIGALIGFTSINSSLDRDRLVNPNDPTFASLQTFAPKVGIGLHVEQKRFYVGFSVPSIALSSGGGITSSFFYNQQFYYGGYNWKINDVLTLKPSIYVRNLAGFGLLPDFNLIATAFDRFTGGLSYRHTYGIVGLINVKVNKQLFVGYSYDYLLAGNSSLSSVSKGSHEIFIRYDFMYLIKDINVKKFK